MARTFETCVAKMIRVFRLADFAKHKDDESKVYRIDWELKDPRLWSVIFFAYFTVFAFFGVLEFTRTSRVLGSLRITLSKMLADVARFLWLFCLLVAAFGISLTELFWYYGSAELQNSNGTLCSDSDMSTTVADGSKDVWFANLWCFLLKLFWGVFGYFDPNIVLDQAEFQNFIKISGLILIAAFYIIFALILINLLIAIMTKSYEGISSNEEEQWRFYRTVIWVRYIRRDFGCPPPMNLIPNLYFFYNELTWRSRQKAPNVPVSFPVYENIEIVGKNRYLAPSLPSTPEQDNLIKHTDALVHRFKLRKLLSSKSASKIYF